MFVILTFSVTSNLGKVKACPPILALIQPSHSPAARPFKMLYVISKVTSVAWSAGGAPTAAFFRLPYLI